MMKKVIFLSCFLMLVSLSAFAQTAKGHRPKKKPKTKPAAAVELVTVEGDFSSKRGVMTSLSCYCYNCGYITTADGERVAVCFEDDEASVDCDYIKVQGEYVTISKESDGACGGGSMTVLKVKGSPCPEPKNKD